VSVSELRRFVHRQNRRVLHLFPDTARVDNGSLSIDGIAAAELVREHGSPLVVYDETTLRARARAYREAAPHAAVVYGTKAFPNVALMRILAEEGIGADVSTLGELRFAQAAGITGADLVVHGNNKSQAELEAAADVGALVVVDSLEEVERGHEARVSRTLVRVTPGIEADTHEAIRTGHHGSKFGLTPDDSLEALRRDPETEGLHMHIGSQLRDVTAARAAVDWIAAFAARAHTELGWTMRTLDLGGGLGVAATPDEQEVPIAEFAGTLIAEVERACEQEGIPMPRLILEPGRSLTARAGVTLYTVGSVKRSGDSTVYLAVDGGMSDNPRPALYGARYTAVLANRADEPTTDTYTVVGKHCESGDLLIDAVALPEPRRGDILAVPATGAYTLAMSSTYNAVPRPAAVLITGDKSRVIRRRETIEDLLGLEAGDTGA
jgi:diaminopimelate decarboxylase